MALIHDIGEAITGDIVPSDGVPKGIALSLAIVSELNPHRGKALPRRSRHSIS